MIAIIAEKPSVGQDIARVVGATEKMDGYITGNGYMVTWALGHLVSLALPGTYGYTRTTAEDLPMIPEPFRLVPRQIRTDRGMVTDIAAGKQLKIIDEVFSKCDSIIVATDARREGELIFRWIYSYLGYTKPFRRLWISSLTDEAIREGMANLREGEQPFPPPLGRRRQPCEGRLAGGHEREPRPGDSLRIGEQLHRPCADSHARHDMRTLQGKPELRLHSILAAAYRAEKRRRAPAVLPPGGLQGQEWGGGRVQAHYFRLCGDHK